jgi:hypothetical protein
MKVMQVLSQSIFDYNPDVFIDFGSSLKTTLYLPNGGCFTPKGDLRALIIFASFGGPYDQQNIEGWPISSAFPDWATSAIKPFYSTEAEFTNSSSDNNYHSASKFYYDMSNSSNRFRLFVDYYPNRIIIDASSSKSWADLNKKVIDKITSFNWSPYDRRNNDPNYQNDYSGYSPDHKPDFVIICYRFAYEWTNLPVSDMKTWCGGCNGYAGLDGVYGMSSNGYTLTSAGFTHVTGANQSMQMFIHETGHSLFNAPHYNGNNGVAGDYFYVPIAGWGLMTFNTYTCALGWERWILDWVPNISANGVNADIKSASDLNSDGIYTLRDFITTGDMIRIKVQNGAAQNQYLWIENHQGKSVFDNNFHAPSFCGANVPISPRGIIAYVETVNDNKYSISNYTHGNGFRFINADGNFDFTFDPTPLTPSLAYCNNVTFNFHKGSANPIGGQNMGERIRNDYKKKDKDGNIVNADGVIEYNTPHFGSIDNSAYNEMSPVVVYDGDTTADYFMGKNSGFSIGQKAGMAENPCVMNIPIYNSSSGNMAPYYINGISFKVLNQVASGNIKIQVKVKDIDINKDVRWASGSIILSDITEDSNPDVNVLSNITLTIDKSGTPNRHTKTTFGDFINPTIFYCSQNSFFKMQTNSKVNVINYSSLILESGSTYEVNDGALLSIKNSSTLEIKSGASLVVKGSGRVEIESGGYICIETGAIINLQDYLSAFNLRNGYQIGLNPSIVGLTGNCSASPATFSTIGNGSINTFSNDKYIQNQTFTISDYISGFNIFAGSNVTTANPPGPGPVKINNGTSVVFDAEGDILLDKDFEVQLGAEFEIK